MLNKFRTHQKRIFIALTVIIIPAFVIWGGISFLKEKDKGALGEIANRKIKSYEFNYYIKLAQLLNNDSKNDRLSQQFAKKIAWDYAILLWKANQLRITVTDREVVDTIKKMFSFSGEFRKDNYFNYLKYNRIKPTEFEKCIRDLLKIDKIYSKYAPVKISEEDIKDLYIKDTKKIKISYLLAKYDNFSNAVNVTEAQITDFYNKNKESLKKEETVKISYALIPKYNENKEEIIASLSNIKNIGELNKFGIEIKQTGFFGINDPIEGLGLEAEINDNAFSLNLNGISEPIELKTATVIIQKDAEKASYIPTLTEAKTQVNDLIKKQKTNEEAKKFMETILEKIKSENITDLSNFKKQPNLIFKETDYLTYYDSFAEFGLAQDFEKEIFSLNPGQITDKVFNVNNDAIISQVKEAASFDQKDYDSKKAIYEEYLTKNESAQKHAEYIEKLREESRLKIYSLQ